VNRRSARDKTDRAGPEASGLLTIYNPFVCLTVQIELFAGMIFPDLGRTVELGFRTVCLDPRNNCTLPRPSCRRGSVT
jgi:hypothetical protein